MRLVQSVILAFLLLTIFQGCEKCNQECLTPPRTFAFQFIDMNTGENLITNGTLTSGQISVIENSSNEIIDFSFIDELDYDAIVVGGPWETSIVNYNFRIDGILLFNLKIDSSRENDGCCDYTQYNEIAIEGAEYELDAETGTYQILVE